MTDLALRPLTLGEILDRTFSIYRRHFLLFVGIAAIPQIAVLAISLAQINATGGDISPTLMVRFAWGLVSIVVAIAAWVFSQGGAINAVSEIYLGRTITVGEAMQRTASEFAPLLGVLLVSGMAIFGATLLLIIPGIYVACRALVSVPAALVEQRGPVNALSRSFELTKGFAGRSFLILLFAVVISIAIQLLISGPFTYLTLFSGADPARRQMWLQLNQVSSSIGAVLVSPISLIATAVFYYDLRVRKEAFDLQMMMNPGSEATGGSTGSVSIVG